MTVSEWAEVLASCGSAEERKAALAALSDEDWMAEGCREALRAKDYAPTVAPLEDNDGVQMATRLVGRHAWLTDRLLERTKEGRERSGWITEECIIPHAVFKLMDCARDGWDAVRATSCLGYSSPEDAYEAFFEAMAEKA